MNLSLSMKIRIIFPALFLCAFTALGHGRDSLKKTNAIVFGELGVGLQVTGLGGLQFNTALNYQVNKSLFTLRLIAIGYFSPSPIEVTPFTFLPGFQDNGSLTEFGGLYGLRFIEGGHSFSFSAGLSFNDRFTTTHFNKQKQIHD